MGRRVSHEIGSKERRHAPGRAKERVISCAADAPDHDSLDKCLNLEESLKLQRMLSLVKASPGLLSTQPRAEEAASFPKSPLTQLFNTHNEVKVTESKRLFVVNVVGSVGPLRVLAEAGSSAATIVSLALQAYAREGRIPVMGSDVAWFDLFPGHVPYGDSIIPNQSLMRFGIRNFVMRKRIKPYAADELREFGEKRKSWMEGTFGLGAWWEKLLVAIYNTLDSKEWSMVKDFTMLENTKPQGIASH